jgi:hypothetical protein
MRAVRGRGQAVARDRAPLASCTQRKENTVAIEAKFLTQDGEPLHPVVEHSTEPDGPEYVKAVINQRTFEEQGRAAPPLTIEQDGKTVENADRFIHIRLKQEVWEALPEGTYDIDDGGNISNITAPRLAVAQQVTP